MYTSKKLIECRDYRTCESSEQELNKRFEGEHQSLVREIALMKCWEMGNICYTENINVDMEHVKV